MRSSCNGDDAARVTAGRDVDDAVASEPDEPVSAPGCEGRHQPLALLPCACWNHQQMPSAAHVGLMQLECAPAEGKVLHGPRHTSEEASGPTGDVESLHPSLPAEV